MSGKSLFKTAWIIALVTVFSKFVGFFRDVIIAQTYGATMVSDAYFYAYQIPALAIILLGGLGGPFHTATIAVFSKLTSDITKKPPEEVQKSLNTFITLTAIFFSILGLLIFLFSDQIINLIASGATAELKNLASMHLKIMSPIMLIGGVIGIFYGIANVYKEFFFTSLSPTMLSVIIIAALLTLNGDSTGVVLAWATLAGAICQLLIQLPVFFKSGFRYLPAFNVKNENSFKIGEILFPAMLGTTIGQINIYVDMFFASRLPEGAWSAIGYANRVFQFPVGILITALLVPLFPMFSTFVAKKDWSSIKNYFHQGLESLWFIAFPILALILLFAQDGIAMLFQRGAFDANDTIMVSEALVFLAISIIPYMARDTLTRIFYSFDDSKTPFYVASFSIIIKALMNFLLIGPLGIGGITLSTTIVTFINAIILGIFIKDKIELELLKFTKPILKITAATIFMGAIAILANSLLTKYLEPSTTGIFIKLSTIAVISLLTYFLAAYRLKINSARLLIEKISSKINKQQNLN